jgi:hypothetical protein
MGDDVEQGCLFEGHAGAVGNVVENQRDAGGIGNYGARNWPESSTSKSAAYRCKSAMSAMSAWPTSFTPN